jgi:hypothetical protein
VALWATQQLLPLERGGEFARGLAHGRAAALELDRRLRQDARFAALAAGPPELDIVVWKVKEATAERASQMAHDVFAACATRELHLALVQLPLFWFDAAAVSLRTGEEKHLTCLRSVLMKPEHDAWLGSIWDKLTDACEEARRR